MSKSATVGIKTASPFEEDFGAAELEGISSVVRSLATDPVSRTIYRIMWPPSNEGIAVLLKGEIALTSALKPDEILQVQFLIAWYGFLRDRMPDQAADSLEKWSYLYKDDATDSRLKALMLEDDGLVDDEAYDRMVEAQAQVARHLLNRTASIAAERWEAGDRRDATEIVKVLLASPLDSSWQDEALGPVIEIGQGLATEVERMVSQLPDYRRGDLTDAPAQLVQLERLRSILADRHPLARAWGDAEETWYEALCWKMRSAALELNKQGDDKGAMVVTVEALKVVRNAEIRDRLIQDKAILEGILSAEQRNEAYRGITPIGSTPSLFTLNGIGTKLYGSSPFPPDSSLRFSILYFTVFYIPVFPLTRYLVESTGSNQWRFFGSTKWTKEMKAHLAITCSVLLFLAITLNYAPSGSTSTSASYSSPHESDASSASSRASDKRSSSVINAPSALPPSLPTVQSHSANNGQQLAKQEKHRQQLKEQLDSLKTELSSVKSDLSAEEMSIDSERSALDAAKSKIDASNPNAESQQEIDDYNSQVRAYESQRIEFNAHVEQFNSKVQMQRELVKRHNKKVAELNKATR